MVSIVSESMKGLFAGFSDRAPAGKTRESPATTSESVIDCEYPYPAANIRKQYIKNLFFNLLILLSNRACYFGENVKSYQSTAMLVLS